ncbi:hypothetical protein PFLUV_G00190620 [Perca fluviatilis]|uniref:Uncharacterized protein n=1 Tax=Perca fluviatilis TaxID=8168 RepID=A0A6A5ERN0_PERFL|nr:hypothetical protein PFLUV_G00190620 [Perca fluviatilis]
MGLGLEELVLVVLDRVAKAQALGQEVWVEECMEQEALEPSEVREMEGWELEQATYLEVAMEAVMVQVLVNTQELVELVPNLLKLEQVMGLVVWDLDLVELDPEESVLVELLCQEEFQCCHRLARLGEDLEERAVVKHQNKFQALGCLDSIKVDTYQAKVLEAVVFSLEWPQDLDLGHRLGPGCSARGVLEQEEPAMVVDSSCLGFFVVTLLYHQNQVMVLAQPKHANMVYWAVQALVQLEALDEEDQ